LTASKRVIAEALLWVRASVAHDDLAAASAALATALQGSEADLARISEGRYEWKTHTARFVTGLDLDRLRSGSWLRLPGDTADAELEREALANFVRRERATIYRMQTEQVVETARAYEDEKPRNDHLHKGRLARRWTELSDAIRAAAESAPDAPITDQELEAVRRRHSPAEVSQEKLRIARNRATFRKLTDKRPRSDL
jgi:hypothetical protein